MSGSVWSVSSEGKEIPSLLVKSAEVPPDMGTISSKLTGHLSDKTVNIVGRM